MGSQNCGLREEGMVSSQAYGDFWVLEHKGERKAKVVKVIEKQGVNRQTIEWSLVKRCRMKHANLCQLYSFHIQEEANIYEIAFEYQYLPVTLAQKMATIKQQHSIIPMEELVMLMDHVSSSLNHLYAHNIKHGCINCNTILSTTSLYKLTDVSSTSYLTLIQLTQKGSREEPISKKNTRFVNDIVIKSTLLKEITLEDDLFSLAIIVLSLATNTPISDFYTFKEVEKRVQVEMKEEVIGDCFYLLRKRYNRQFQERVKRMMFSPKPSKDTVFFQQNQRTHQNSHFSIINL